MVQPAGAGPAVGTGENRCIAEGGFYPAELAGRERKRGVPIDRNEWLGAAPRAIAFGTAVEVALAHMRAIDAACFVDRLRHRLRQRRRMLVLFKRLHADDASVPDFRPK